MKVIGHETVGEESICCTFGRFYKVRNLVGVDAIKNALGRTQGVEEVVGKDFGKDLIVLRIVENILFICAAIVDMIVVAGIKLS